MPTANKPWDTTFTTNERQVNDFLARVRFLVDQELSLSPARILEVGCGDGGKIFRLAGCWPQAKLTGIDISRPNINMAEQQRACSPNPKQIEFLAADYLTQPLGKFDLVLADSVLHLIPGSTDRLFAKVAGELKPGGLLLFTMPCACPYNTLLWLARRTSRLFRSRLTDWLLLTLAARWHRGHYSRQFLQERLEYAYIIPFRTGSRSLEQELQIRHHLVLRAVENCPHVSFGQPKHRLWCFRYHPPTAELPASAGRAFPLDGTNKTASGAA